MNTQENTNARPTVDKVIPIARAFYAKPGNQCGGNLHIVLDDGNVKDSHVLLCIEDAEKSGDSYGAELGRTLMRMTKTQRLEVYRGLYFTP